MDKKIICFILFLFLGVCPVLNAETAKQDTADDILGQLNVEQNMAVAQMLSAWIPFRDELKITDAQAKQLSQLQLDLQKKMLAAQQSNIDMQQKMLDQNYAFSKEDPDKMLASTLENLEKMNKDIEGINQKLKSILTKEQYDKLKNIDFNAVLEKQHKNLMK